MSHKRQSRITVRRRTAAVAVVLAVPLSVAGVGEAAGARASQDRATLAQPAVLLMGMGDSYTAQPLVEPQDPASGACNRSRIAYPVLAARALGFASDSVACSGAWPQFFYQRNTVKNLPPQSTQISGADIVALTVGPDGVLGGGKGVIMADPDDFVVALEEDLEKPLTRAYESVYAAEPDASVFVLEYPDVVPRGQRNFEECFGRAADGTRAADAHENVTNLNLKIQEIVGSVGATFVPTSSRFLHHEQCTADPYAEGLHPNNAGNRQMAAALVSSIRDSYPARGSSVG